MGELLLASERERAALVAGGGGASKWLAPEIFGEQIYGSRVKYSFRQPWWGEYGECGEWGGVDDHGQRDYHGS